MFEGTFQSFLKPDIAIRENWSFIEQVQNQSTITDFRKLFHTTHKTAWLGEIIEEILSNEILMNVIIGFWDDCFGHNSKRDLKNLALQKYHTIKLPNSKFPVQVNKAIFTEYL